MTSDFGFIHNNRTADWGLNADVLHWLEGLLPVIALGLAFAFAGVASAETGQPAGAEQCIQAGGTWDQATLSCIMPD